MLDEGSEGLRHLLYLVTNVRVLSIHFLRLNREKDLTVTSTTDIVQNRTICPALSDHTFKIPRNFRVLWNLCRVIHNNC